MTIVPVLAVLLLVSLPSTLGSETAKNYTEIVPHRVIYGDSGSKIPKNWGIFMGGRVQQVLPTKYGALFVSSCNKTQQVKLYLGRTFLPVETVVIGGKSSSAELKTGIRLVSSVDGSQTPVVAVSPAGTIFTVACNLGSSSMHKKCTFTELEPPDRKIETQTRFGNISDAVAVQGSGSLSVWIAAENYLQEGRQQVFVAVYGRQLLCTCSKCSSPIEKAGIA